MKNLILLFFVTFSATAAECELTAVLPEDKKIETSFVTSTLEECQKLAGKTSQNRFFGLIESEEQVVETTFSFKEEEEEAF